MQRLLTFIVIAISLSACTPPKEVDITANWSVDQFYAEAKRQLDKGNFLTAIEYYETLESRFPFGKYATQSQIDVAFAYYKFGEPDAAIVALDRFIKLHPRHESVDYAYYLKGVVNFERGGTILDFLHERDLSAFDRNLLLTAYKDFRLLTQRYPSSQYAGDSRKRFLYLRDELARGDYNIANFYASRDAWVAVLGRTKQILKDFQGSAIVKPTLKLQLEAYQKLGLDDAAKDTQRILKLNYPDEP